jgi:hypothetical protein
MIVPNLEHTNETLACLIIDDPLLRPQYGCLNYNKLLQEMKEHRFFTEIAFIPWNYQRSDPKTVDLLANNPEYFGLCVHGCNHTFNEFGEADYRKLNTLSSAALWRMDEHKKLTGLAYDPVMVFPQGRFSSEAILALKDQGYQAAFNSTLRATDTGELSSTEYRQPATTLYHDFPLYLRRYPKNREGLLHDLASGRPIIIVEHHTAFKNGYKNMANFIDWVNGLGNIKWKSLSYIANYYYGNKINVVSHERSNMPASSVWDEKKVALRRFACEFRDAYIEPSRLLTKVYKLLRGMDATAID